MSTSFIALGIASGAVIGLVIGLGLLSLGFGIFETFFGKAKLIVLKSSKHTNGFAFALKWNSAKDPAKIDRVRVKLFNPHGKPTQLDISRAIDTQDDSFATEVDMGPEYLELLSAQGLEKSRVQVELASSKEGIDFQFEYAGAKFKKLIEEASETVESMGKSYEAAVSKPPIDIPTRSFIADTVPGKGAQLAIATNPAFEAYFQNMGGGGGAAGAAAGGAPAENFAVSKVWIAPGCIVCNACEDIYPEVFDVQADTCIIRPNAPLDNGLKIQEAAEACPVEVIKFDKA